MQPSLELLLIEDNPADVVLTKEALEGARVPLNINVAQDGDEALRYLAREGEFADRARPDLVLLDLNLPGIDGKEVLKTIKSNEELKEIPVIVLTTSQTQSDVRESYRMHANCFVTKPKNFKDFLQVVQAVEMFWFKVATLPNAGVV